MFIRIRFQIDSFYNVIPLNDFNHYFILLRIIKQCNNIIIDIKMDANIVAAALKLFEDRVGIYRDKRCHPDSQT